MTAQAVLYFSTTLFINWRTCFCPKPDCCAFAFFFGLKDPVGEEYEKEKQAQDQFIDFKIAHGVHRGLGGW